MKKFLKEFRDFATKGNVLDLAVGVIIGGAFQKIVTSLVNDMIMPFIGVLTGNTNFNDQFVILRIPDSAKAEGITANQITSLELAKQHGVSTFNYGSFLSAVLDFVIMAFIIFLMIKGINKIKNLAEKGKKSKGDITPATKKCPFCLLEIPYAAVKCGHCTSDIPKEPAAK